MPYLVAILVAAAAVLAGCGGGQSSTSGEASGAGAVGTAEAGADSGRQAGKPAEDETRSGNEKNSGSEKGDDGGQKPRDQSGKSPHAKAGEDAAPEQATANQNSQTHCDGLCKLKEAIETARSGGTDDTHPGIKCDDKSGSARRICEAVQGALGEPDGGGAGDGDASPDAGESTLACPPRLAEVCERIRAELR